MYEIALQLLTRARPQQAVKVDEVDLEAAVPELAEKLLPDYDTHTPLQPQGGGRYSLEIKHSTPTITTPAILTVTTVGQPVHQRAVPEFGEGELTKLEQGSHPLDITHLATVLNDNPQRTQRLCKTLAVPFEVKLSNKRNRNVTTFRDLLLALHKALLELAAKKSLTGKEGEAFERYADAFEAVLADWRKVASTGT